jgi:predicted PurR-regulated permease PerM
MNEPVPLFHPSPKWSPTAKTVVGLTIAGILVGLLIYFRSLVAPLMVAVILAYLLHPVADRIKKITHLSWRLIVTILYLLVLVIVIGILTLSGLAIVNQAKNLIGVIQNFMTNDLANIVNNISQYDFSIGPFKLNMSKFDLNSLTQQLVQTLEPQLGRLGTSIGAIATSALATIGMLLFVILISYFLLSEAGQFPDTADFVHIPGYDADVRRMGAELGYIWNAFIRGQLLIISLTIVVYTILMTGMGVRNWVFIIAILAGLARLVPYLGPTVTWTVTVIVTVVQGDNYFGLSPVLYAAVVVAAALVVDQIFDNIIYPLIFGQVLRIHPALLLIGALAAARLFGLVGLLLAAPVIATVKLVGTYTVRKMLDLDPWQELDIRHQADLAQKKGKGFPQRVFEIGDKARQRLFEMGGKIRTRWVRFRK